MDINNLVIKKPDLDIKIFSSQDFENLSWHDVLVRGVYFNDVTNTFVLLIDYVIEWIHPNVHKIDNHFRSWKVPAILKFIWINDLEINLKLENWALQFTIDYIIREKVRPPSESSVGSFYKYVISFSTPTEGKIVLPLVHIFQLNLIGEPFFCDNSENYKLHLKETIMKNLDEFLVVI